jgi:hypothetical protein
MLLEHLVRLPRNQARAMLKHTPAFEIRAFLRALGQLPEALARRMNNASHYLIGDRDVLRRSQKPAESDTESK